jgi:hypothetical protein
MRPHADIHNDTRPTLTALVLDWRIFFGRFLLPLCHKNYLCPPLYIPRYQSHIVCGRTPTFIATLGPWSYLYDPVTASLKQRELWGGFQNMLPHPLSGSFSEVNLLLLGPAHVTNLLKKNRPRFNAFFWSKLVTWAGPSNNEFTLVQCFGSGLENITLVGSCCQYATRMIGVHHCTSQGTKVASYVAARWQSYRHSAHVQCFGAGLDNIIFFWKSRLHWLDPANRNTTSKKLLVRIRQPCLTPILLVNPCCPYATRIIGFHHGQNRLPHPLSGSF